MRAKAFNTNIRRSRILVFSALMFLFYGLQSQPKCYQALIAAAGSDIAENKFQDALNKFRAALTCDEISAKDDRLLRERITLVEEQYREHLFDKIRKSRKRADAYDLMFKAMEIKEKDPNMALSYLQMACELADNAIAEINAQRRELLQDPGLIVFSKYFSGFQTRCLGLLPDGYFIAGGMDESGNNYVKGKVENIENASIRSTEYPVYEIIALESSPSLPFFVMADNKGRVFICDADDPAKITDQFTLQDVACMSLSPDGSVLAIGNDSGKMYIISIKNKKKKGFESYDMNAPIKSLAFSPDGKILYAAAGKELCRFRVDKYNKKENIRMHENLITSIVVSETGNTLFFGDNLGIVARYSIADNQTQLKGFFQLHSGAVNNMQTFINQNGETILLSSGDDGRGVASDIDGKLIMEFVHDGPVNVIKYARDKSSILTGGEDGVLRLWEIGKQSVSEKPVDEYPVEAALFKTSFRGESFAMSTADRRRIILSTTQSNKASSTFFFDLSSPAVSLTVCPSFVVIADENNNIYRCGTDNPAPVLLDNNQYKINGIAISPDCKKIATVDNGQYVTIRDSKSGNLLLPRLKLTDTVTAVAYSPDNTHLLVGKNNQSFNFLNSDNLEMTGAPFYAQRALSGDVSYVEYSPDGQYALSLTNNVLEIWNMQGAPAGDEFTIAAAGDDKYNSACFSKDGKYILVATNYSETPILILPVSNIYDKNAAVYSFQLDGFPYVKEARFLDDDRSIIVFTDDRVLVLENFFQSAVGTLRSVPLNKKIEIGVASFDECMKAGNEKDMEDAIAMFWNIRVNALEVDLDSIIYQQIQLYRRYLEYAPDNDNYLFHLRYYASVLMSYAERLFNKPESKPADYHRYARKSVHVLRIALDESSTPANVQYNSTVHSIEIDGNSYAMFKMELTTDDPTFTAGEKQEQNKEDFLKLLSDYYVNLSFYDIYAERFDDAIRHADSSLILENQIRNVDKECRGQAVTNRALGYLFKGGAGNLEKAKRDYKENYKSPCIDDPKFKDMKTAFLSDLDALEIHFTRNKNFQTYLRQIEEARRYIKTLR